MRKLITRILATLLLLLLASALLLGYSYFVEPNRLVIREVSLAVPNFSESLNGLKIVAISDIHGGSNNVTEERLRELVTKANEQKPDIIVLLGDYVSQIDGIHSDLKMPVETIANNLRGFEAKYGVYGVIGNHDWWYDEKSVRAEFERIGVKILENHVHELTIGNESVWLWGIEDYWKRRQVPVSALETITKKQNIIAVTHNPDSMLKAPVGFAIMIAGHSHGGQANFPFYGRHPFVNDPRFMAGEAVADGKHVFVTAGIGTSVLPLRFRVPPEISVITLNAVK